MMYHALGSVHTSVGSYRPAWVTQTQVSAPTWSWKRSRIRTSCLSTMNCKPTRVIVAFSGEPLPHGSRIGSHSPVTGWIGNGGAYEAVGDGISSDIKSVSKWPSSLSNRRLRVFHG